MCGNPDDAHDLVQQTFERRCARDPSSCRSTTAAPGCSRCCATCSSTRSGAKQRARAACTWISAACPTSIASRRSRRGTSSPPATCARCWPSSTSRSPSPSACTRSRAAPTPTPRALGVSINTVSTRILRARRKLRALLTERLDARAARRRLA
jgi:hypothetical protein